MAQSEMQRDPIAPRGDFALYADAVEGATWQAAEIASGRRDTQSFSHEFGAVGALECMLYAYNNLRQLLRMLPPKDRPSAESQEQLSRAAESLQTHMASWHGQSAQALFAVVQQATETMETALGANRVRQWAQEGARNEHGEPLLWDAHMRERAQKLIAYRHALNQRRAHGDLRDDELEYWMVPFGQQWSLPSPAVARNEKPGPSAATMRFANGVVLPILAFGTWRLHGDSGKAAMRQALDAGFRRFDTAANYRNEDDLGEVLAGSGVPRGDYYITTKIGSQDFGREQTLAKVREQLAALRTDYVDLYLVHGPGGNHNGLGERRRETWQVMEELLANGTFRAIGVSNYDEWWLNDLLTYAKVRPHLVQNKGDLYHPGAQMQQDGEHVKPEIGGFCRRNGIVLEAYSPLSGWPWALSGREDPHVKAIADVHQVTPAQVVLRWLIERGIAPIVRSSSAEHIVENGRLWHFALTDEQRIKLDSLQWMIESPLYKVRMPSDTNLYGLPNVY